ncbi:zinc ABC transporter substrate-binding protein [Candidatus Gottesmanbacteria bacterium]|nr:zinc ABC transporter substrate-binding protein [Candidatus Gottesmanbacteria bacterium]
MKIKLFLLGILTVVVISYLFGAGIFKKGESGKPLEEKMQVVASFYPLWFFASEIGKEKVHVTNITPPGAEPHEFEPGTGDIVKIELSKMLIINGAGLEPWAEKLIGELERKGITVVTAGEDGGKITDPHVWLDPVLAKLEVKKIGEAFIRVDPQNKSFYEENIKTLDGKLASLDQEFRNGLTNCKQKNIVTSHAAFGYVSSRYGLEQIAISGLSPEQEPSPQELGEVAKFARDNNVKYIFFETLVSPRLAETIASEIGAETLVFDPLEGLSDEDQKAGKDYFSAQRENLENLKTALQC